MDTVSCSGSESKLINCTHHRDTSEDEHSEDIRPHCGQSTPPTDTTTGPTITTETTTKKTEVGTGVNETTDATTAAQRSSDGSGTQLLPILSLAIVLALSTLFMGVLLYILYMKLKKKSSSNKQM